MSDVPYPHDDTLYFEEFRLDRSDGLCRRHHSGRWELVVIGSRAVDILRALAERRGQLVTKQALMDAVWSGIAVEDANLTVQISALRRILDDGRVGGSCIQTVVGRGYRFRPTVMTTPAVGGTDSATQEGANLARNPPFSIVIMPFANQSDDPEQAYFAEVLTEDLTTDMSRISGSFVISRSTALTYTGKPISVKQVGQDLGVRYALEGSVRRAGQQLRITAHLIDTETGAQLWAERFDIDRSSLIEAQLEITGGIAQMLNLQLIQMEGERISRERRTHPDARDYTIRGWAVFWRFFSKQNNTDARRLFEKALETDPDTMDAKVGLATTLLGSVVDGWSDDRGSDVRCARQLIDEVIAVDPSRAAAQYAHGVLYRIESELDRAAAAFEATIALDPNHARAMFQLGQVLIFTGNIGEAIPKFEKAVRLSPRDPNSAGYFWGLGYAHLLLGNTDQAIEWLKKARNWNDRLHYVRFALAAAHGLRGNLDDAKAELAECIRLAPEYSSYSRYAAGRPWLKKNPRHRALCEASVQRGLRRAGLPDE